jgi:hypothetical protein
MLRVTTEVPDIAGNEDVRRGGEITIIISRFTQKLLIQMVSQYDILALGVVRARSAQTGLDSAILIQLWPGFNSLRSCAIITRGTHEKGEPNYRFLTSQFRQGTVSSTDALGRVSADRALWSLL